MLCEIAVVRWARPELNIRTKVVRARFAVFAVSTGDTRFDSNPVA